MSLASAVQYAIFLGVEILLVKPVGDYLYRVFSRQRTPLDPVFTPIERLLHRAAGIDAAHEMNGIEYALAFLLFSLMGTLLLYAILRLQTILPGAVNGANLTTPLTPDLAFNTSVSFSTTTTWQAYAGETTMTYLSQILGLTAQNFLAGAGWLAVGVAFLRGFAGRQTQHLGNFWVDLIRAILWVLLPLSLIGSLFLVWQGAPMNFLPYAQVTSLEGTRQTIAQGPVAALAAAARGCGARFFMAGALRLGPNIEPWFTAFLRTERPDLAPLYRRLYPAGYAPRPYVERLRATVAALRADFGLPSAPPPLQPAREPAQLAFNW